MITESCKGSTGRFHVPFTQCCPAIAPSTAGVLTKTRRRTLLRCVHAISSCVDFCNHHYNQVAKTVLSPQRSSLSSHFLVKSSSLLPTMLNLGYSRKPWPSPICLQLHDFGIERVLYSWHYTTGTFWEWLIFSTQLSAFDPSNTLCFWIVCSFYCWRQAGFTVLCIVVGRCEGGIEGITLKWC